MTEILNALFSQKSVSRASHMLFFCNPAYSVDFQCRYVFACFAPGTSSADETNDTGSMF